MRWLVLIFLSHILVNSTPASEDAPPVIVPRYRNISLRPACFQVIATLSEQEAGEEARADERFEDEIEATVSLVQQTIKTMEPAKAGSNYARLKALQTEFTQGHRSFFTLTTHFPYASTFDDRTHARWEWLSRTRDYRIAPLRLRDASRLHFHAEFAPAIGDVGTHTIRFNLLFNMDAWLESLDATDLADPDTILVGEIAQRTYFHRVSVTPAARYWEPNPEFLTFLKGRLREHPTLITDYIQEHGYELPLDEAKNHELGQMLVYEMWLFFGARLSLFEMLRFGDARKRLGGYYYHQLHQTLTRGTPSQNQEAQQDYIVDRYQLSRVLVETLWDDLLPTKWQNPPENWDD